MYTSCKGGFYMKKFFSFIFCLFITCCSVLCVSANFPNNREVIHLTSGSDPTLRLYAHDINCKRDTDFLTRRSYLTWLDGSDIRGECIDDDCDLAGHWVANLIDAGSHTYVLQNYATYTRVIDHLVGTLHMNALVLDEAVTTSQACCWSRHNGHNQQWVFEPIDNRLIYFRLRNRATGRYLTMNSADSECRCYGWHWVNDRDSNYKYQIWEKH